MANVHDGFIAYDGALSMNFTPRDQAVYSLRPGDLLLNEGQSVELVGRCAMYDRPEGEFCFQNTLIRYRCGPELVPSFALHTFKHWLTTRRFAVVARQTTSIAHLGADRFADMAMAMPALAAQQRIAEVLDTLDDAIRSGRRMLSKLEVVRLGLTRSLLADLPSSQPSSAGPAGVDSIVKRLGDISEVVGGVTLGRWVSGPDTIELPYLRVANVQDGYIDTEDVKRVRILRSELNRYELLPGDVLMTEGGDFDKLGRGAVWDGSIRPCLHQNHIFRVRCAPGVLDPRYLAIYSASPAGRRYFLQSSKQTTNLASINMTQVKNFPLPIPAMEVQGRIADCLQAHSATVEREAASLAKLRHMRQGLADDLLTGRVRVEAAHEMVSA